MIYNEQNDDATNRKESIQLLDSPGVTECFKKESFHLYSYDHELQARDKKMQNIINEMSEQGAKVEQQKSEGQIDSSNGTPQQKQQVSQSSSNTQKEYTIMVNDIEDTQNGRLLARLNTYDLRQQFFKNENQYPQHLFIMNSHIAQWGRLQDNIKAQYLFLKQENDVKNQMIEDLKIYQLKMIKNNLKFKFLLKERSRYSMVHDIFQEVRPKMRINIQNFETEQKDLIETINKNQDVLKSMMLKIAQNPLLLAFIIEQNNQYDNNLDQFLDDVNSLFYERVLVDNQYHNPIYILQAYLIERELSKAQTPEDAFKMSNLSTKTIYAFSKNINCVIFLEKILYKPLKNILNYPHQIETNLSKLYDQIKKKPKQRRAAIDLSRPSNVDSIFHDGPIMFAASVNLMDTKLTNTLSNSHTPSSHTSRNPITQIKSLFFIFNFLLYFIFYSINTISFII